MQAVAQLFWYFIFFIIIFAGAAYPAGKILFFAYGKKIYLQILLVIAALVAYFISAYLLFRLIAAVFPWASPPI